MKVLHISNDFAGSKVHYNLFKQLDKSGIKQIIYCPTRNNKDIGKNYIESKTTNIIYSYVIKPWYKYVYYHKQRILYKDLCLKIKTFKDIDVVHASTLFSDGGIAYKIKKKYNIPYVVAVRNTDVNTFGKLLPHSWIKAIKILLNAEKVYFISRGLQDSFKKLLFVKPIIKKIEHKFIFRANGIDKQWLDSVNRTSNNGDNILYIGNFSANKNVSSLIKAIYKLRQEKEFNHIKLTIIGGDFDKNNEVSNMIKTNNDFIEYLGKIYDISKIQVIMQQHALFAMPSFHETFGLVYIEALSQNLPIIYTKGQGVDKLFNEDKDLVGIAVNPHSTESIKNAIKEILVNRDKYSSKQVDFSLFDWKNIAEMYRNDYEIIKKE